VCLPNQRKPPASHQFDKQVPSIVERIPGAEQTALSQSTLAFEYLS